MVDFPLQPETPYYNGKWIMPPGRPRGVREVYSEPGKVCGLFSEQRNLDVIPVEEWDEYLEKSVDLQLNSKYIFDQDGVGSCGSEGKDACSEIMLSVQSGEDPPLFNPFGTYFYVSGGRDQGSSLQDNVEFAKTRGSFREELHPRSLGWRQEPSEEAKADALNYRWDEVYQVMNWEELGSANFQGFVGYCAYAGHAWAGIRPVNKSQYLWRNSWGEDWGNKGYGVINANRIQFQWGIFVVRTMLWVPEKKLWAPEREIWVPS